MTKVPKTYALAAARKAVGPVERLGENYVVYGPYRDNDIHGVGDARYAWTYPEAQSIRANWVAHVALTLMGVDYDGSEFEGAYGDAAKRVSQVLRRLERRAT